MSHLHQGALHTVGVDEITQRVQNVQRVQPCGIPTPNGWGEERPTRAGGKKEPCQEHTEKNQPESQGKQVFVGRDHDQGKTLLEGQEKNGDLIMIIIVIIPSVTVVIDNVYRVPIMSQAF